MINTMTKTVFAVLCMFPLLVNAFVLTDIPYMKNDTVFNVQEIGQWAKDEVRNQANQYLEKQLALIGFENSEGVSLDMLRIDTSLQSSLFNLQLKREIAPDENAKSFVAKASIGAETENICSDFTAGINSELSAFDLTQEDVLLKLENATNEDAVTNFTRNAALFYGDSNVIKATKEQDVVEQLKLLIPSLQYSTYNLNQPVNIEGKYRTLETMKMLIRKLIAQEVMKNVLYKKVAKNELGMSQLQLLNEFADELNESQSELQESNSSAVTLAYRRIAIGLAFQIKMDVDSYKDSLNEELLLVSKLIETAKF